MDDCLSCIFNYLPLTDIINCFSVCKQYNNVADNITYWKMLLDQDFHYKSSDNNYKEKYQQHHKLNNFLLQKTYFMPIDGKHLKHDIHYAKNATCFHYGNFLKSIPSEIGLLTHLKSFIVVDDTIQHIPSEIGLLTNLTKLDLSGNQLMSLPIEIGLLTNLGNLDLSGNKLRSIPKEIGLLTNIHSLNLSKNLLENLPKEIVSLTKLLFLNILSNKFESLPEETKLLTNLRSLEHN